MEPSWWISGAQLDGSPKHSALQGKCLSTPASLVQYASWVPSVCWHLPWLLLCLAVGPARPGLGGKLQACGDLPCSSDMVPACRTDTSPRGRHSPGSDGQTRGMIYNLFQGIIAANGQPRFALPQGGRAKSINGESNVARPAGSVA